MSTVVETRNPAFANSSNVPPPLAIRLHGFRAVTGWLLRRTIFTTPDSRLAAVASAAPGPMGGGWIARVRSRPTPCSDVASVRG
jgi:hypothetical protein